MILLRQGQWRDFAAVKLGYILARSYNPCCSVASASRVSSKGLCMVKQGGGSFGKVTKSSRPRQGEVQLEGCAREFSLQSLVVPNA
ncbi:hypothetical protein L3X38_002593 [Prunus dulcis]|uniref:Uncharacterized protein n=1 Tax=Prunus dulcis TaxID=3755 RepID=A0AAD4ZKX7_PRUDU|nr:hypothetical protein L3X38_002593 [Prunus dulcis]